MVVHGEQRFSYERPLHAGDVVTAQVTISDIKTLGRNSMLSTTTRISTVDGEDVCTAYAMLVERGDWVPLGSADEGKPAAEGTVEAWGRSSENPVGGWYGLKKGLRGRFGNYVPPVLEALGLAEVEHQPRNNRMRAT